MGGIPLAALAVNTQQPNPLDTAAKAMNLQNIMQEAPLRQAQVQEAQLGVQQKQQQLKDQQAVTAAMHQWDGKDPDDLPGLVLKQGGSANAVFGLKSQILDQKTKVATLDKDTLANQQAKNDVIAGHLESVKSADPASKQDAYTSAINDLVQKGYVKPGQLPQQYPGDDQLTLAEKQFMGQKAIVEQEQNNRKIVAQEQEAKARTSTAQTASDRLQAELPGGPLASPERAEMQDWLSKNPGKGASDYAKWKASLAPQAQINVASATGAGKSSSDVAKQFGMSPEAFDQAAEKYYHTGVMLQMGRGAAGMALQRAIMNRTGELHPGESLAEGSAEYAANKQSLGKLQGNLDSVSAFESTALKNLQLFRAQAQKVIDTGIPLLNAPLRSAAKMLGSQDQAGFETALQVANNEIAKVTSSPGLSGVLSDSARKEVENYNPKNATIGQAMHVADILEQDMANRHVSYQQQINDIKGRMGGKMGGNANQPQNPPGQSAPSGATHTGIGSVDKKKHWLDAQGKDLGVAE